MEAEDTEPEADERDVEVQLSDCGAEEDESEWHEERGERAEVESALWFPDVVVASRAVVDDEIRSSPREEFSEYRPGHQRDSETDANGTGF